jgi:error-prone DNA polymerase
VSIDVDHLPLNDQAVYKLLCSTHTLGVFQLESPGQRELQGRLQPQQYFDIVCAVALFRPGPVEGGMVEPFIRRRWHQEPVTYPHPSLEPILKDTFGLILFQEQVLEVAAAIAGISHGEADQLRRAMTHDRSDEEMARLGEVFMARAAAKGTDREIAERVFATIRGFAAYGFCRAHAAAFGFIAYQSAYLKAHYPAEFFAGILTHLPGFYPAHTLLDEARRRGVGILPLDINRSQAAYTVEEGKLRIPLGQARGLSRPALDAILTARRQGGPFASLEDFVARATVPRPAVENLILAGAFESVQRGRRSLLWRLPGLIKVGRQGRLPGQWDEAAPEPESSPIDNLANELDVLSLALSAHPLDVHQEFLQRIGAAPSNRLERLADGSAVTVAGLVIARMTPPMKSGQRVMFLTLEDRFGLVDAVVFPAVQERFGREACFGAALVVRGTLRRMGKRGVSVTAESIFTLAP